MTDRKMIGDYTYHSDGEKRVVRLWQSGHKVEGQWIVVGPHPQADEQPEARVSPKRTAKQLAKGAVAVAQEATGTNRASREEVDRRWAICLGCEHLDAGLCRKCGCGAGIKIRRATAKCPISKW